VIFYSFLLCEWQQAISAANLFAARDNDPERKNRNETMYTKTLEERINIRDALYKKDNINIERKHNYKRPSNIKLQERKQIKLDTKYKLKNKL